MVHVAILVKSPSAHRLRHMMTWFVWRAISCHPRSAFLYMSAPRQVESMMAYLLKTERLRPRERSKKEFWCVSTWRLCTVVPRSLHESMRKRSWIGYWVSSMLPVANILVWQLYPKADDCSFVTGTFSCLHRAIRCWVWEFRLIICDLAFCFAGQYACLPSAIDPRRFFVRMSDSKHLRSRESPGIVRSWQTSWLSWSGAVQRPRHVLEPWPLRRRIWKSDAHACCRQGLPQHVTLTLLYLFAWKA